MWSDDIGRRVRRDAAGGLLARLARAAAAGEFMFGGGPSRRFIGEMSPSRIRAYQIIPGGQSGILGSPAHANMLGRWLTNSYHEVLLTGEQVDASRAAEEQFTPGP
mgnify:CR=1 FL=1